MLSILFQIQEVQILIMTSIIFHIKLCISTSFFWQYKHHCFIVLHRTTSMRQLKSDMMTRMVAIQGIVISASRFQTKAVRLISLGGAPTVCSEW